MSGTITAIAATIQMCLAGQMLPDGKCDDGQSPFTATMDVLSGDMVEGCNPDWTTRAGWTKCVKSWTSIIKVERDGQTVFILLPDGKIEAREGFQLNEMARAFWEAMALASPSLKDEKR